MAVATQKAGRVIQITGPVVDIEFAAGELPAIYNAVEIERKGADPLVCEVQQHLGNNVGGDGSLTSLVLEPGK